MFPPTSRAVLNVFSESPSVSSGRTSEEMYVALPVNQSLSFTCDNTAEDYYIDRREHVYNIPHVHIWEES